MNEQFCNGNSLFHALDPRVKILSAFTLTLFLALTNHFTVAILGLLFGLIFLFISQVSLLTVAKRLVAINTFTLFLWITLPFTYNGHSLLTLGPFSISSEGVRLALLITLKTNSIVLFIISLPATSTISDLGHALSRLKLPTKLCYLLLYSYRYIFVIHQEFKRLLRAAKIRNFTPKTSIHTYRTFGYLIGMTVVKSWNRSKRVQQAMILRGFTGKLIPLTRSHLGIRDYWFLFSIIIILISLLMMDHFYPCSFAILGSSTS